MHVHQLAELAGLAATQAPTLLKGRLTVGDSAAQEYWTASRCRLDRWSGAIKKNVSQLNRGPSPASSRELYALCEEVLASEILTRVWAVVAKLHDEAHNVEKYSSVAANIYHGHLEARHKVLHLIANGPGLEVEDAIKLNRLRRRCERWTDMLVGYLSSLGDVEDYVFDAERARDFAEDLSYGRRASGGPAAWALLSASLKSIFGNDVTVESPCADLNRQIASSIIACYPPETFDGQGVAKDQWLSRLTRTTDDTQNMIAAFMSDMEAPA